MKIGFAGSKGAMVAAVALVAAFVPVTGQAAQCSDTAANTLKMTVSPKKSEWKRGGTIKLAVHVTRGVADDDQQRVPASGVEAIVVLNPSWPYMAGAATTDREGNALVKIEVPKDAPRGWLDGHGTAQAKQTPPVCGESASEQDAWNATRVVKIRR
jgi:hypothetical protein